DDERGLSYRYIGKMGFLYTFTPIINSKYFILEQGNGEKIYWRIMYDGIVHYNGYMTRTELYNERKISRSAMQDLMDGCMSHAVHIEYYRQNQEIKEIKENTLIEKQQRLERKKMRESARKKIIEQKLIYDFSRRLKNKIYSNWVITSQKQGSVTVDVHLSENGKIIGKPKLLKNKQNKKIYDSIVIAIEKSAPFTPPKILPYSVWKNLILSFTTHKILVG
ncbi:cell envelope integrity protein TolA, partial [Acidithiobacillus thiooxidans]|uniref:cell envelope integrity protein TolA n=1 Tax=Acidithiobacillus thiooxidans TaxID=930 RepID=UPI001593C397